MNSARQTCSSSSLQGRFPPLSGSFFAPKIPSSGSGSGSGKDHCLQLPGMQLPSLLIQGQLCARLLQAKAFLGRCP